MTIYSIFKENTVINETFREKESSFSKIFINFAQKFKRINMEERKLNRIKVVLAEKDKTGRWLSEKIGKSNCTVSKYINQKVQPDLKTLNLIADILEVDVKDLLISNKI